MRIAVVFLLAGLAPFAYAADDSPSMEARLAKMCDNDSCVPRYREALEAYRNMGCGESVENCEKAMKVGPGKIALDEDSKKFCGLLREAKQGNKGRFPSPEEFAKSCIPYPHCIEAGTAKLREAYQAEGAKRCSNPDTGGAQIGLPMAQDPPFAMSLAGGIPAAAAGKSKEAVAGRVVYVVERDQELEGYADCVKKEKAAGGSFCARIYADPPGDEYGKAPPPEELLAALARAHAAGLSHKRQGFRIEFQNHEGCLNALARLDRDPGEISAYFRPHALDAEKTCNGLTRREIGSYWRFLQGTVATLHRQPALYLGHYETP